MTFELLTKLSTVQEPGQFLHIDGGLTPELSLPSGRQAVAATPPWSGRSRVFGSKACQPALRRSAHQRPQGASSSAARLPSPRPPHPAGRPVRPAGKRAPSAVRPPFNAYPECEDRRVHSCAGWVAVDVR